MTLNQNSYNHLLSQDVSKYVIKSKSRNQEIPEAFANWSIGLLATFCSNAKAPCVWELMVNSFASGMFAEAWAIEITLFACLRSSTCGVTTKMLSQRLFILYIYLLPSSSAYVIILSRNIIHEQMMKIKQRGEIKWKRKSKMPQM